MKTKLVSLVFILLCSCLPLFAQENPSKKMDNDGIYFYSDKMPEFPGGMEAMMKFLSENLRYPVEAQQKKISGKVFVHFVVMEDGTLGMEKVIKGVDPLLDAEALRVVKSMPKFIPGSDEGKAVKVRFSIPIVFNLTNNAPNRTLHGFEVPMQGEIRNKTLEGVWQSCQVGAGEKNYRVMLAPVLKILSPDKTFMNLFVGNGKVSAAVLAKGNYEKASDNTFIESLEKSAMNSFIEGAKNEITFEFLTDNLMKCTFMVPGRQEPWVEYWFRIPTPESIIAAGGAVTI